MPLPHGKGLVNICKTWRYSPLRAKHDRFIASGFFKAAAETDKTRSKIGRYGCQNPVTSLPVLRVWDDKVNAHTVA